MLRWRNSRRRPSATNSLLASAASTLRLSRPPSRRCGRRFPRAAVRTGGCPVTTISLPDSSSTADTQPAASRTSADFDRCAAVTLGGIDGLVVLGGHVPASARVDLLTACRPVVAANGIDQQVEQQRVAQHRVERLVVPLDRGNPVRPTRGRPGGAAAATPPRPSADQGARPQRCHSVRRRAAHFDPTTASPPRGSRCESSGVPAATSF